MNDYFFYDVVNKKQYEFLHKVLDLGIDFINGDTRNDKVINYMPISELKSLFDERLPLESSNLEQLYEDMKLIATYSISQADSKYLAFPDTGNSCAALSADILAASMNQNLIAVERSGPIATIIEMQLILWLRHLVGYINHSDIKITTLSELGGMWTSGGNMSNYIAIHTALRYKFPQIIDKGIISLKKRPIMILSKGLAHYSFLCAAQVLGLGKEGIIWADTNEDYTTNVNSINSILESLPDDVEPFLIVSVAGNCRTSSIDNLKKIGELCKTNNLWYHVDACHGGSLLFSEKLRKQIDGIEMSDSISLDPHKGLFVTYSSSYVLFKNPHVMNSYCRYPHELQNPDCLDLGLITPFYGSRGFESLKLWMLLRHMGVNNLGQAIESRNEVFKKMVAMLQQTDLFVFFNEPQFYRVAFVFYPKIVRSLANQYFLTNNQILNIIKKYTVLFSNKLYKRGKVVLDLFSLEDMGNKIGLGKHIKYDVIGMSIGHSYLDDKVIDEIKTEVTSIGSEIKADMEKEIQMKDKATDPDACFNYVQVNNPASW